MAAYTEAQIQEVCELGYEIMGQFTDVQNCNFPSTAIINGMKAGNTPEEIACAAYDAIKDLPMRQTGFGLVGDNRIHNIALYMQGAIQRKLESFE